MGAKWNVAVEMLFALLRASLHRTEVETDVFQKATDDDWKECHRLAVMQGVMALAWDGVSALPPHLQPAKGLKLKWAMAVEAYEKKYARYCQAIAELSDFYQEHGITTVQLKGVGLSTYYPNPAHREGGDIDIFTYSADTDKMTDAEANLLADNLMKEQGIEVDMHSPKHSNFYYKGIPIENHKTFLNVERFEVAKQVEQLLKQTFQPQATDLLEGKVSILTPSPAFNTLFLAFHSAQHYGSGLALHHLCDWAMLITRHGLQITDALTDQRFREAMLALTELCNRYLGTSVKVTGGEKLADEMIGEIIYPKFTQNDVAPKGKLRILLYKSKRFIYRYRINNRILYMPLWKYIWESILIHVRKPETIFQSHPK